MPGEPYQPGGVVRGFSELVRGTRELALDVVRSAVQFGKAVEKRGSTVPLLRRFSLRPSAVEYEAIPLGRPGSGSPV